MGNRKYVTIQNLGKVLATDIAKLQGYDLRTKKGKSRVAQILKQGKYLSKPSRVNYKQLFNLLGLKYQKRISNTQSLYNSILKKYKFDNNYEEVEKQLSKFNKSKKLKKIEKGLIESWDGDIGSNLKSYIDRFTPTERNLFNKIIGKMSNKEIEERFAKYATLENVSDLSYLYYPPHYKKRKGKKITADEMLADDNFRLDTLKKYTDIFLKTAKNGKEYNRILNTFNKIAKAHEEFYEE